MIMMVTTPRKDKAEEKTVKGRFGNSISVIQWMVEEMVVMVLLAMVVGVEAVDVEAL